MSAIENCKSSSSSDSEDDETAKLKSAVDPDFLKFLTRADANAEAVKTTERGKIKSKREVASIEWESGHFVHPLKLTPSNQEFIAKQLSVALDGVIRGVDRKFQPEVSDDDHGIFLFRDSSRRLRGKDLVKFEKKRSRQKKPSIKRKKESNSSSDDEAKLKAVAVSSEWVRNPSTV